MKRARHVRELGLSAIRVIWWLLLFVMCLPFLWFYLTSSNSPLPDRLNPGSPLDLSQPENFLTQRKLRRAVANPSLCQSALSTGTNAMTLPSLENSDHCHIAHQVVVRDIGQAKLSRGGVKTACATALRLAAWERYGLQPEAKRILGTSVTGIAHMGSYNCRFMRTGSGSKRWSTHATAEAIDIAGFDLSDGRKLRLIKDWEKTGPEAAFLRAAQASSCQWFVTTLGPDYNALHADHFHLQTRGWGTCR